MGDKIYKYEDLIKISNLLIENNMAYDNLTINIGIKTEKMLNRINHDFYFKFNKDSKSVEIEDVREINILINGIKFRYYLIEDDIQNK